MPAYKFIRVWTIEKGTVLHRIAQQSLISKGDDPKAKDYELFTDDGNIVLTCLYIDMCRANRKAIAQEEQNRLKV